MNSASNIACRRAVRCCSCSSSNNHGALVASSGILFSPIRHHRVAAGSATTLPPQHQQQQQQPVYISNQTPPPSNAATYTTNNPEDYYRNADAQTREQIREEVRGKLLFGMTAFVFLMIVCDVSDQFVGQSARYSLLAKYMISEDKKLQEQPSAVKSGNVKSSSGSEVNGNKQSEQSSKTSEKRR